MLLKLLLLPKSTITSKNVQQKKSNLPNLIIQWPFHSQIRLIFIHRMIYCIICSGVVGKQKVPQRGGTKNYPLSFSPHQPLPINYEHSLTSSKGYPFFSPHTSPQDFHFFCYLSLPWPIPWNSSELLMRGGFQSFL